MMLDWNSSSGTTLLLPGSLVGCGFLYSLSISIVARSSQQWLALVDHADVAQTDCARTLPKKSLRGELQERSYRHAPQNWLRADAADLEAGSRPRLLGGQVFP